MKKLHQVKVIRTATVALSLDILLKGQLRYLNQFYNIIAVSGKDNHLEVVQKREGVNIINAPMKRPISPISDLISLVKLYKVFKKEKPTVVHSITPKAGLLNMLASKIAGVPIRIHTYTGLIFPYKTGLMQRLLIAMDKLLCACATTVIPEGEGVKKDLIKYGITKKPLHIIANGNVNGIDTSYFKPNAITDLEKKNLKQSLGISSNDFVFVFVGRLVKDKGINELVSAFKNLNNPTAKLILVGTFEDELDPLEKNTKKEIETNPNILSVGWQSDIRPYLAIAHCFTFPSYREGFPNVVLQAGAMELPCIVTNISGSNEIIRDHWNGLIIEKKNATALEKKMNIILNDQELYQQLKKNSRKNIQEKYEQQIVWEGTKNLYDTLIKNTLT